MESKTSILMRTKSVLACLLLAVVLSSCHCIMREKTLIVSKMQKGNSGYKYCYFLNAFPVDQVLYSNQVYNVGDTVRMCR